MPKIESNKICGVILIFTSLVLSYLTVELYHIKESGFFVLPLVLFDITLLALGIVFTKSRAIFRKILADLLMLAISTLICLVIIDFTSLYFLHHPDSVKNLPIQFKTLFGYFYCDTIMNIIQYEENCTVYNPVMSYKPRPGKCDFNNIEFNSSYSINELGFRDDSESLQNPEMIVLGDSTAMGWGVNQNETYAEVIEKEEGIKVLNTAVSSYGTAREVMTLNMVDASNTEYIVIHYDDNDYEENEYYVEHNNKLDIMTEEEYKKIADTYERRKKYFPGEYTLQAIYWTAVTIKKSIKDEEKNHTKYFIDVLLSANKTLQNKKLIVLTKNQKFIEGLKNVYRKQYPNYIKNMKIIDLNQVLNKDDYYILDGHMRASGHKKTAEEIIKIIQND